MTIDPTPAAPSTPGCGVTPADHPNFADQAAGIPVSVWVTGQQVARTQLDNRFRKFWMFD